LLLFSLAVSPVAGGHAAVGTVRENPEVVALAEGVRSSINDIRRKHRLPPLSAHPDLARLAADYSRRMAREGFFDHYDPAGRSMADRVKEAGIAYRTVGENIFRCRNVPDPVRAAVDGWMASPPHRQIILHPAMRETGVGVWEEEGMYYFTQIFIRKP
jgi:uncharacterized protein YkwD